MRETWNTYSELKRAAAGPWLLLKPAFSALRTTTSGKGGRRGRDGGPWQEDTRCRDTRRRVLPIT